MPDYGLCAQCAREIDSQTGYSNRRGERICIPCQFSAPPPTRTRHLPKPRLVANLASVLASVRVLSAVSAYPLASSTADVR